MRIPVNPEETRRQAMPFARLPRLAHAIALSAAVCVTPLTAFAQDPAAPLRDEARGPAQASAEPAGEPEPRAIPLPDPPSPAPEEPLERPYFEDLVLPGSRIREAFRIRLDSRFLPGGSFDTFDADLYRPELAVRATVPVSERALVQLVARFGSSLYDLDDGSGGPTVGAGNQVGSLFTTGVTLQGGVRLNDEGWLFVRDESWSLFAVGAVESSWESGAFDEAIVGRGSLGLGYEIEGVLRLALGIELENRIDRQGIQWSPTATFRWNVSDRFIVRSRGLGLKLEYAITPGFEIYATSFHDGDLFRLEPRPGLPDDLTFRDESIVAGLGLTWKLSKHFRLDLEGGAVAWREMRVKSREQGKLFEENADPGAYFDLRLELRP